MKKNAWFYNVLVVVIGVIILTPILNYFSTSKVEAKSKHFDECLYLVNTSWGCDGSHCVDWIPGQVTVGGFLQDCYICLDPEDLTIPIAICWTNLFIWNTGDQVIAVVPIENSLYHVKYIGHLDTLGDYCITQWETVLNRLPGDPD